jgi:hypothetical protein
MAHLPQKNNNKRKKFLESPLPILLIERYSYVPHVYK